MGSDGTASGPPVVRRVPMGPGGPMMVLYGSLHESCTNTGQSSDPSSPVGSCRAKSGFRRKPVGTRHDPTGPNGP